MHVVGIAAARMASTRYPDKPMVPILGMPMIGHVFHRSLMATSLDDVWVATCDESIATYIDGVGGRAIMTSSAHQRATERIAEALPLIEQRTGRSVDVAVLLQGDEPMLLPAMVDELVAPFRQANPPAVTNLISAIETDEEFGDANTVKVVLDRNGDALYFSREAIPSVRKYSGVMPRWKQLGMIAFTREALLMYVALEATPLEIIESVDMNRFLEHGHRIRMVPTRYRTAAVDTPHDRERVEQLMRGDDLIGKYLS